MTQTVSHVPALVASADNRLPQAALDQAREYASAAQSAATRRAYESDWRDFSAFCASHGACALPATPQTVALYVSALADRMKVATIRRRVVTIAVTHKERGLESPTTHEMVRRILRGIARTKGVAQAKKSALTLDDLKAALLTIRHADLKAKRDRALLLLGFSAALRRSELAALDVSDLRFTAQGLVLTVRRSKTDQTGEGVEIAVPFVANESVCAARAVREWLSAAAITEGAAFRSFTLQRQMTGKRIDGRDVANLVKSATAKAHLQGDYSGHSLRAGFVTSAAQAGATLDNIARTTRHKSIAVLTGYIRRANLFEDSALATIVK